MNPAVDLAVPRLVAGPIEQVLRAERILIGLNVVILQGDRVVVELSDQRINVRLTTVILFLVFLGELILIVSADFRPHPCQVFLFNFVRSAKIGERVSGNGSSRPRSSRLRRR